MIPRIYKLSRHAKWWNGHEWGNFKWMVDSKKNGYDLCYTFSDALRYWLWHCGVSPKIAFGWFKRKKERRWNGERLNETRMDSLPMKA